MTAFVDFRIRAACGGMTELFDNGRKGKQQLAVCANCPVKAECLKVADGLKRDGFDVYGTFGGKVFR